MVSRRPKKGKKACTECRQQKAKCDVYLNPDQPCTRCRKVNANCIVSEPFKREHKRKRISDLERESEDLRRKLRSSQPADTHLSPIALLTAAAEMGVRTPASDTLSETPQPPPSYPPQLLAPTVLVHSTPGPAYDGDTTKSRTLNGIQVSAQEIDDLFQIFFRYYAQFLPILDPQARPNTYYAQSPFLFWAIIGVACRAYSRNPTLLMALARSIIEMALLSTLSVSPPSNTIQGILLLLTWPFPKGDHPDVTFPMGGILLHIAMQNGLHIPMSSHEFSRVKMAAPSDLDLLRRSELWAHSIIVYQRVCVTKGQLPRALGNLGQDPAQHQGLFENIAPWIALKLRCQELIAKCSEATTENGLRTMSLDQERALDLILRTYEGQVDDLELQAVTDDERFDTALCRMAIQSFHLYKNQTLVSSGCYPRILVTACSLIDYIQSLCERVGFLSMAPVQMGFALLLASTTLLRILKSSVASQGLEISRARASLFTAINLAQQMSVDSADLAAKTVTILKAVWNSSKAFRKIDGTEYSSLRIRSRLVLSLILDTVWWWRDEFDPGSRSVRSVVEPAQGNGYARSRYPGTAGSSGPNGDTNREVAGSATTFGVPEGNDAFHLDEQFLADFEWALADDTLFSLDPLSSNWSTTNNLL
ncbi:citrate synthase [Penicillium atrosanguineum]|uniref:citrate synthase n=1 Tax=Penicillium atrosanguineum TaxID=1132637 RepID=UPI00238669F1|nr:citrate synthase [Penicillium atrosanguineum]KAJ5310912.1 citrate synthase [Penicillium atrosanguineum]